MTKICALGNSHLAALMLGWKEIAPEYPDVEISFFAARGPLMRGLVVRRRKLVPQGKKLRRYLKVNHKSPKIGNTYDGYLVAGLDFGWKSALESCNDYRAESHARDNRTPISDSCFAHTLRATLRSTVAAETIGKLRQIAPAPISLVPVPLPASGRRGSKSLLRVEKSHDDRIVAEQLDRACMETAGELGVGFVGQPEFTKASPLRTRQEYTHGSLMFASGRPHGEDDIQHMNARYGQVLVRMVLQDLLTKIDRSEGAVEIRDRGARAPPTTSRHERGRNRRDGAAGSRRDWRWPALLRAVRASAVPRNP